MLSRSLFLIRESLRGFFHNKFMTFVVVTNIAISLFFIGSFFVVFLHLNKIIAMAEEKITLEVFLEDGAADVHVLKNEMIRTPGVLDAEYLSKEDAYRIFSEEVDADILTAIEGNPLPASFKVKIQKAHRTPEKLKAIREQLKRVPFVEEVSAIRGWVPKLEKARDLFITISMVAITIIGLAMFFTISSTIRLTFLARRDLFRVMELVGAPSALIRIPFFMEGVLKGFLGGALSAGLLFGSLVFVQRFFPEIHFYNQVFWVQLGAGVFLGMVASAKTIDTTLN